jgi:hypothetical protein
MAGFRTYIYLHIIVKCMKKYTDINEAHVIMNGTQNHIYTLSCIQTELKVCCRSPQEPVSPCVPKLMQKSIVNSGGGVSADS